MAIDTPARLAILGAGPIGLEAALYARFLGYEVVIYERGEVAESVRQSGQVEMLTPFRSNRTALGLAAVQAQDEAFQTPADDALLTCSEWRDRYLLPLAASDLLSDHLRTQTNVTEVVREEVISDPDIAAPREESILPSELTLADDTQEVASFRVHLVNAAGEESIDSYHGVLDCTGLTPNPNWLQISVANPRPGAGPLAIVEPQPNFYVLGSKNHGRGSDFPVSVGYDQIREVFKRIGGRATLDLYASAGRLIR